VETQRKKTNRRTKTKMDRQSQKRPSGNWNSGWRNSSTGLEMEAGMCFGNGPLNGL